MRPVLAFVSRIALLVVLASGPAFADKAAFTPYVPKYKTVLVRFPKEARTTIRALASAKGTKALVLVYYGFDKSVDGRAAFAWWNERKAKLVAAGVKLAYVTADEALPDDLKELHAADPDTIELIGDDFYSLEIARHLPAMNDENLEGFAVVVSPNGTVRDGFAGVAADYDARATAMLAKVGIKLADPAPAHPR